MDDVFAKFLRLWISIFCVSTLSNGQQSRMGKDSECYTPNGRDYTGKQNTTYVKGSGMYEPTIPNVEVCLPWKDQDTSQFNVTLTGNYCRNPNNRLFPWCYVMKNGAPGWSYCHIPTCSTPALIGCFKLYVNDDAPPKGQNVTTTGPPPDLILDGEDSITLDSQMRIARCLNFCRSKKYDYAGVTGGDSCMCGTNKDDGAQMRELINHLHPHMCLQYPCADDRMQACGGDNAIAIYDVEAGSCDGVFDKRDVGVIYSPRWPGNYHNEAKCGWTIYVPEKYMKDEETRRKHQMHVYFSYFNLETKNDTLKIYTYANSTDTNSVRVASYSGSDHPAPIVLEVSEVYAVHIVFNSDPDHKKEGFILHYNITNLEGQMETTLPDVVITETTTTSTRPTTKTTTTTTKSPQHKSTTQPSSAKTTTTTKAPVESPSLTASTTTIISGATKSTTPSTNSSAVQGKQSSGADGGMIAGIVIGILVFLVLVVLVALYLIKWRGKEAKDESTPNPPAMFNNPVTFNSDTTL
ncbi:kremen protein 1-like isoform X1 [Styela clava]